MLTWADGTNLGAFTTDSEGAFSVSFTVPDVPTGSYLVSATADGVTAEDDFSVEVETAEDSTPAPSSIAEPPAPVADSENPCTADATREVGVSTALDLERALVDAQPGDRIQLANGTYTGNFETSVDGIESAPIMLCGTRAAIIDCGGWEHSGYALHLTADYWIVSGITVTNAQKGIIADGVQHVTVDGVDVHTIGHEAIHFRANSSENIVQESDIHDTGLDQKKFGEGIYFGTAVSNRVKITDGEPDRGDRNAALRNRIWNTSAESIDIKEGTTGGVVEGNAFDGSRLSRADSWVDVKGNEYRIVGNVGTNASEDGVQTRVINDLDWGRDNEFERNTAVVHGPGYRFYIHQPENAGNVVTCDNIAEDARSGLTNLPDGCTD